MNISTRLAYKTSLIISGATMLLSGSVLFISPLSAYADSSLVATSTDNSDSSSTTPATTSPALNFAFSIPVSDPTGDNPIPVTATFSQPVTGFQVSSLTIGAGHVDPSSFIETSPTTYSFNVVVTVPNGTVSIDSNDGNVKNSEGQVAIAAPQLHVRFDDTLPNYTDTLAASGTGLGSASTTVATSTTTSGTGSTMSTTTPPYVFIISGPTDGSVIATSTATFTFATDGVSVITCSFGAVTTAYGCGSPQTFSNLVDGVYPFTVFATYLGQIVSTSSTFSVNLENASSTTATSTATSTDSTASSTPTTDSSDESTSDGSSDSTIFSGGISGGSSSGGSIPGYGDSSSESDGSPSEALADGTYVPSVVDNQASDYGSSSTNYTASNKAIYAGEILGTSTETTATSTLGGVIPDAATDGSGTQEAAASTSSVGKEVLWGSLILIVILLIGGTYWYSRRTI